MPSCVFYKRLKPLEKIFAGPLEELIVENIIYSFCLGYRSQKALLLFLSLFCESCVRSRWSYTIMSASTDTQFFSTWDRYNGFWLKKWRDKNALLLRYSAGQHLNCIELFNAVYTVVSLGFYTLYLLPSEDPNNLSDLDLAYQRNCQLIRSIMIDHIDRNNFSFRYLFGSNWSGLQLLLLTEFLYREGSDKGHIRTKMEQSNRIRRFCDLLDLQSAPVQNLFSCYRMSRPFGLITTAPISVLAHLFNESTFLQNFSETLSQFLTVLHVLVSDDARVSAQKAEFKSAKLAKPSDLKKKTGNPLLSATRQAKNLDAHQMFHTYAVAHDLGFVSYEHCPFNSFMLENPNPRDKAVANFLGSISNSIERSVCSATGPTTAGGGVAPEINSEESQSSVTNVSGGLFGGGGQNSILFDLDAQDLASSSTTAHDPERFSCSSTPPFTFQEETSAVPVVAEHPSATQFLPCSVPVVAEGPSATQFLPCSVPVAFPVENSPSDGRLLSAVPIPVMNESEDSYISPIMPTIQAEPMITDPAFRAILDSLHGELELSDLDQYVANIDPMPDNANFDLNRLL